MQWTLERPQNENRCWPNQPRQPRQPKKSATAAMERSSRRPTRSWPRSTVNAVSTMRAYPPCSAANRTLGYGEQTLKTLEGCGFISFTIIEAANVLGVHKKTLLNFFDGNPLAREIFKAAKGKGTMSLRRKVFALSDKHPGMCMFLLQNLCAMKDVYEAEVGPEQRGIE